MASLKIGFPSDARRWPVLGSLQGVLLVRGVGVLHSSAAGMWQICYPSSSSRQ